MRHLYLLRGVPAVGKSTLIEKYGLGQFTLSADDIRGLYGNNVYDIVEDEDGNESVKEGVSQRIDKAVWSTLIGMLESRMERGETTIIDATHTNKKSLQVYNKLASDYRYRIFTIQLDKDLETLLMQNRERHEYKRVPEKVIVRKYNELLETTDTLAKRYNLHRFTNIDDAGLFILNNATWRVEDIDEDTYKRVYVIGDIHASYDVLDEFLQGHYDEEGYYVFVGDYLDRGLKPYDTVNALHKLLQKPNVVLLRGNHELNYENWLKMPKAITEEQVAKNQHTQKQYEDNKANIKKYKKKMHSSVSYVKELEGTLSEEEFADFRKKVRDILSHVQDIYMFRVQGQVYMVTHGGITVNPMNYLGTGSMIQLSANMMVKGIGGYGNNIDELYTKQMFELPEEERIVQIHGHRNKLGVGVLEHEYSINLEQGITDGGYLGVIEIDVNTGVVHNRSLLNKWYRKTLENTPLNEYPIQEFYQDALGDKYVQVKELTTQSGVYAVNFNRDAFKNKVWNGMTVKARGLFINPEEGKVVARSYDKFFNINERPETKVDRLKNDLEFPIEVSAKVNGFLGILTVYRGEFLYLSKSTDGSRFSQLFKEVFTEYVEERGIDLTALKDYIVSHNVSLVFEVIDQEEDPHIIRYEEHRGVVLLDVFKNQLEEEVLDKANVDELKGFITPETIVFHNYQEFEEYVNGFNKGLELRSDRVVKGLGTNISKYNEGFVVKDARGFKVKYKSSYYKEWKGIRPIMGNLQKGNKVRRGSRFAEEYVLFIRETGVEGITGNILDERKRYVDYVNAHKQS